MAGGLWQSAVDGLATRCDPRTGSCSPETWSAAGGRQCQVETRGAAAVGLRSDGPRDFSAAPAGTAPSQVHQAGDPSVIQHTSRSGHAEALRRMRCRLPSVAKKPARMQARSLTNLLNMPQLGLEIWSSSTFRSTHLFAPPETPGACSASIVVHLRYLTSICRACEARVLQRIQCLCQ